MIDVTSFLTPYDIFSTLGSQGFDTSTLLTLLHSVTDDAERESSAFLILERRRKLHKLKKHLESCSNNEKINLTQEQLHDVKIVNGALVSFMVSGINEHLQDFQMLILSLVKNKMYDFVRLKEDVQAILCNDISQLTEFRQLVLFNFVQESVTVSDILPLFELANDAFSMVYKEKAQDLIAETNAELMSVELDDILQIIFDTTKKKALSVFVHDRSTDAALRIYIDCFDRLLNYEIFDVDKYIDKACNSLIDLEEVIS